MEKKINPDFYHKKQKHKKAVDFDDSILSKIEKPSDLKSLSLDDLENLASQVRGALIETVSHTGGHLSSNLGVVELTIAIHYCFDSPRDKIIFDVGHQCYTHKMLTGRYSEMDTLRQEGGISGFTNPDESIHDCFFSGHASTSVSAGYGLAQADKICGRQNAYTVVVVGDGAATGGEIYEAMNNAGRERSNLIVILNDNEMSISESLGSLAKHLAIVKSKPKYFNLKARVEQTINKIPVVGVELSDTIHRVKTSIKKIIYKQSTIFEELGFRYMGPLDGHNIATLIDALNGAKTAHFPMLVHVKTKKGKGYEFAEKNPDEYHGVSTFDIDTGESKISGNSFSSKFGEYICSLARNDNSICAVTAAMSIGTGLEPFKKEFPDRFFDVGIAEEHAVTFCSGLAKGGMTPVFAVYSAFLQRGYDQIIHDVALQKIKMLFVVDRCGFVTGDGETHHGLFDVSYFNSIPNITVYSPSTFEQMRSDIFHALYENEYSSVVRLFKGDECVFPDNVKVSDNDFDIFGQENAKNTIVTYSRLSLNAYNAFEDLNNEGKSVRLILLNKIKPLDEKSVDEAAKSENIFFFEESIKNGGVGEIFCESLSEKHFKGNFYLRAVDNEFVKHSTAEKLISEYGFDTKSMVSFIEERTKNE